MNNGYYGSNPTFPGTGLNNNTIPNQQSVPSYEAQNVFTKDEEMSYIENILRLNKGKMAKVYVTIPGSEDYKDKLFTGVIEQAGRDHIILSNPTNGEWYLILMIYLDFVTFEEPIPDLFRLSQSGAPVIFQVTSCVALTVIVVVLFTVPNNSTEGDTLIVVVGTGFGSGSGTGSSSSSPPQAVRVRLSPTIKAMLISHK